MEGVVENGVQNVTGEKENGVQIVTEEKESFLQSSSSRESISNNDVIGKENGGEIGIFETFMKLYNYEISICQ